MSLNSTYKWIFVFAVCVSCNHSSLEERKTIYEQKEKCVLDDTLKISFSKTLNKIDQKLNLLRQNEGETILGLGNKSESFLSVEEHILQNLEIINSIMENDKEKLNLLFSITQKIKDENNSLEDFSTSAKEQILRQKKELTGLKNAYINKSFEAAKLSVQLRTAEQANLNLRNRCGAKENTLYTQKDLP